MTKLGDLDTLTLVASLRDAADNLAEMSNQATSIHMLNVNSTAAHVLYALAIALTNATGSHQDAIIKNAPTGIDETETEEHYAT